MRLQFLRPILLSSPLFQLAAAAAATVPNPAVKNHKSQGKDKTLEKLAFLRVARGHPIFPCTPHTLCAWEKD